ncbi:MAG: hypothetical protein GY749_00805 [Desulfobacteraceae bacterium]|nr:hypothetical protein [Desulfobacteraceae bacterium]
MNDPEIAVDFLEAGYTFQVQFKKKLPGSQPGTGQVPDKLNLLEFCENKRTIKEMMAFLNLKHRETFTHNYLRPLMNEHLVAMTIPDKPNSPRQKYHITPEGVKALEADIRTGKF